MGQNTPHYRRTKWARYSDSGAGSLRPAGVADHSLDLEQAHESPRAEIGLMKPTAWL